MTLDQLTLKLAERKILMYSTMTMNNWFTCISNIEHYTLSTVVSGGNTELLSWQISILS